MDINWYGQAFFKIKGKSATVVTDPFNPEFVSLKAPKDIEGQVVTISHDHGDHNNPSLVSGNPLIIQGPGEFEKSGVTITGTASFHDNQKGAERGKNTIYHISIDGVDIVHLGDLGHELTDDQVSEIGNTDILMIPVGGVFTIDADIAAKVVAQLEPMLIIPMHYKIEGLKFELDGVENFLKKMGQEGVEPVSKLTITRDKIPTDPQIVVLSKS